MKSSSELKEESGTGLLRNYVYVKQTYRIVLLMKLFHKTPLVEGVVKSFMYLKYWF